MITSLGGQYLSGPTRDPSTVRPAWMHTMP
jgi:hypothetical protein